MGNYALAHSVLAETVRCLEEAEIVVSTHSAPAICLPTQLPVIQKDGKVGRPNGAARMFFAGRTECVEIPAHLVNILTSTIICCQRSGLKALRV